MESTRQRRRERTFLSHRGKINILFRCGKQDRGWERKGERKHCHHNKQFIYVKAARKIKVGEGKGEFLLGHEDDILKRFY